MLDSESQLQEAIQKLERPQNPQTALAPNPSTIGLEEGTSPSATTTNAVPTNAPPGSPKTVYICPMPEHVTLEYAQPGKCSLCGMTLVPVSQEMLAKIQPGGRLEYYTCPMPEHSDIHADKPGKCPHCGMTLIPVMKAPPPAPEPSGMDMPKH
jgi:rubrerythrin